VFQEARTIVPLHLLKVRGDNTSSRQRTAQTKGEKLAGVALTTGELIDRTPMTAQERAYENLEEVLASIENMEIDLRAYYEAPFLGSIVDGDLERSIRVLRFYADQFGREDLVSELDNLEPEESQPFYVLGVLKDLIAPELSRELQARKSGGVDPQQAEGLTDDEIYDIVHEFVGRHEEGCRDLIGFTHSSLTEILRFKAGVPQEHIVEDGPKHDRLFYTLRACPPEVQGRILRALLDRFDGSGHHGPTPPTRDAMRPKVEAMLNRFSGTDPNPVNEIGDLLESRIDGDRTGEELPGGPINLLVSSPMDLAEERQLVITVCKRISKARGVDIRPILWEGGRDEHEDVPGLMASIEDQPPQKVINRQVMEELGGIDVYVGMVWHRMGTPTDSYGSGTEAELEAAIEAREASGRPHEVLFYEKHAPYPPDIDADQLTRVTEFIARLQNRGIIQRFEDEEDFISTVGPDIERAVQKVIDHRLQEAEDNDDEIESDVGGVRCPECDTPVVPGDVRIEADWDVGADGEGIPEPYPVSTLNCTNCDWQTDV
jgi:hypothetical protein